MRRAIGILLLVTAISACKKDEPTNNVVNAPGACAADTYCFRNASGVSTVDYSGQTARLEQLTQMSNYIKARTASLESIEAAVLSDMFSNANGQGSSYFSAEALSAGKQLRDKCFLPSVDLYEALFTATEAASQSMGEGSNGTPGVLTSINDPSRSWFFDANGFEPLQLIEKGLIGDVFYYQALHTYLSGTEDDTYDNTVLLSGKPYTEAEHKFDEAFGYLGAPVDFLSNQPESRFHARYSHSRNAALNCNTPLFGAFLEVRQRLHERSRDGVVESCEDIRLQWHRVIAGTAIHYLKQAQANMDDPAVKCHVLSEAYAFIGNLRFGNEAHNLSDDEINTARALLGNNFHETTTDQISDCVFYLLDHTAITLDELALL